VQIQFFQQLLLVAAGMVLAQMMLVAQAVLVAAVVLTIIMVAQPYHQHKDTQAANQKSMKSRVKQAAVVVLVRLEHN
jgi:uncharacterized membrane protein